MNPYHPRPESALPKLRKPFDSFLEQVRGEYPFGQPNCEHCAEFSTVMQHLEDLSYGAYQWTSVVVSGICVSNEKRPRRYLLVGCSNPEPGGLPNSLCFCFPLFIYRGAPGGELKDLVCFAPESVVSLSKGLYWEDGELKGDSLEDWDRFWKPLSGCLQTNELGLNAERLTKDGERLIEAGMFTLEGVLHKDSVTAVVKFWSQSRKRLQDEIDW